MKCPSPYFQKKRDPLDVQSYRPISLLNQDYKIFTALLTKRLNRIIGIYIHPDQSGFIPNRDIMDNVFRALELVHYSRNKPTCSSIILSLDIEKAFDRIEHDFLLDLLSHMKFGPKFQTALWTIYVASTATVGVNGHSSQHFGIARGTPQGCPLFPLLFALAVEPLAEALRHSAQYSGIPVGAQVHKLSRFADNMALYMTIRYSLYTA